MSATTTPATQLRSAASAVPAAWWGDFEREMLPAMPALARRATRLTRDPDAAADLVQDTLEHGLRGFGRYARGTNARAWLLTIMHNLHVSAARRRARRPLAISIDALRQTFGWEPDALRADVEVTIADRLGEEGLLRQIAALPPAFRTVVELADVHGVPHRRIARLLDLPAGTVASRLCRGRRRLQVALRAGVADIEVGPTRAPRGRSRRWLTGTDTGPRTATGRCHAEAAPSNVAVGF